MCNSELGTFCLSFSLRGCRKYALHTISGSLYTPDTKSTGMPFDTPRACFIAYFFTREKQMTTFLLGLARGQQDCISYPFLLRLLLF